MRRRTLLGALALAAGLLCASSAQARTELLRWQHPAPAGVAGFTVLVGSAPGQYSQQIDVGKPTPQAGVYTYSLSVPDSADVYVAIQARGTNGLVSAPSNEQLRAAPTVPPPPPALGVPGKPVVTSP